MTIKACYTDDYSFELSEMDAIYFPEDEKEKEISESVLQMDFS